MLLGHTRCCYVQVLLNVAKEAPGCFLPHLQSLVQQVEQLWAAGQLREGEKVRPCDISLCSFPHCPAIFVLFESSNPLGTGLILNPQQWVTSRWHALCPMYVAVFGLAR